MNITGLKVDILNRDNYDSWKVKIKAYLKIQGLWKYVSGELVKPEATDNNAQAVQTWEENDDKAMSMLIMLVDSSEISAIRDCKTSHETWTKLESIYQSRGPARMAALYKRLILQRMQEGENIHEHIKNFFDTVDKLHDMGEEIKSNLLSILLLCSLPDTFENFRCAIETRDSLPSPEELKIKIVAEHQARQEKSGSNISNAMVARKPNGGSSKTKFRKKDKLTDTKSSTPSFRFACHKCKKKGHKAVDCTFKKEDSEKKTSGEATKSSYHASTKDETALRAEESAVRKQWCLDSGCTSHMCKDEEAFEHLSSSTQATLNLANNASTKIVGIGEIEFSVDVNGEENHINLNKALYVPDLRTNLMSVGRITDKGYRVLFEKNAAYVVKGAISVQGEIRTIADRVNDLYYVREKSSIECKKVSASSLSNLEEWHRRLGHLNERDLTRMVKLEAVKGLNIKDNERLPTCETCIRGKLTRAPFPISTRITMEPLEIIHSDLCGPMRTQSNGGARYFVTFIDDFSRWCEVRFLKHKSDVLEAFKEFKKLAETQTGKRIKCLQSDNGKEYCNSKFDEFLKQTGIKRRLTVSYCPEQNGIAERKNRTLVEMARCLLIQSGFAMIFWAEAINTANHLRNRCPTRSLEGHTPHEKWTGRIPHIGYFRSFGTKVLALNKKPTKGKFDSRSTEGYFIGYSETSKAYRIWIPSTRSVETTRDVKFLSEFSTTETYEDFIHSDTTNGRIKVLESVENKTPKVADSKCSNHPNDYQDVILDLSIPEVNRENPSHEESFDDNTEDEDIEQQYPENSRDETPRRGPGRPRILRTGKRGRPKKLFNERNPEYDVTNNTSEQTVGIAEVSLRQALSGEDAQQWKNAIIEEVKSLIRNNTWELVSRPNERDVIGSRIVLRNKYKPNGILDRRKARIVAKGFTQRPGLDFHDTFAPVARLSTIRLLSALAVQYDMEITQIDITTAYLNGRVEEDIFMELPEFFTESLEEIVRREGKNSIGLRARRMLQETNQGNKVCHLNKALYGLRQSGRQWHKRLDQKLKSLKMKPTSADPCLYYMKRGEDLLLAVVYVDDILIASRNPKLSLWLKQEMSNEFDIKDLGRLKYCLGMEFIQDKGKISISQEGYVKSILEKFGMLESKPVLTPGNPGIKLDRNQDEHYTDEQGKKVPYRELIGSLMFLSVATRPDISHIVSSLSQFNENPSKEHWIAAKRVIRYLKGTMDLGIVYEKNHEKLIGHVDADWGSCIIDRRSYTGYVFSLSGGAISWESRKQRTVALSSTEAEYMALSDAGKEAMYLQKLVLELDLNDLEEIIISSDNLAALSLAKNPVFHGRSKHIDVRHHFIRDLVESGDLRIEHVPTNDMMADILTKSLSGPKHQHCVDLLGLRRIS